MAPLSFIIQNDTVGHNVSFTKVLHNVSLQLFVTFFGFFSGKSHLADLNISSSFKPSVDFTKNFPKFQQKRKKNYFKKF